MPGHRRAEGKARAELTDGIYVHWPFCKARCPYCDFNAHVWQEVDHLRWRNAILAELRHAHQRFDASAIDSVFFGGGTPSLMRPATIAAIVETIDDLWGFANTPEVTLEANPTSSEADHFRAYADAGVNRISVGAQSLRDRDLRALGRNHTAEEALAAFAIAADAVPRVSFDLISARPGQNPADWRVELQEALAVGATHLSIYQLTIEPGTRFADLRDRGRLTPLDEGVAAEIYEITAELTGAAGLPAYEISNHARPDEESRHNLLYWRGQNWIGIGPGAHGRPRRGGRRLATRAVRDPAAWIAAVETTGHGFAEDPREIAGPEEAEEYLMMALRLREGASLARFGQLAGRPLPPEPLDLATGAGLLRERDGRMVATLQGWLVLDAVLRELLAAFD